MQGRKKKRCDRKIMTAEYQALKKLRLDSGLTLKDAASRLDLSFRTVSAIENGRVNLDKKRIEEIVKAYGLKYMDYVRAKKIIQKEGFNNGGRRPIKVLTNEDRRSYQKNITKECRVLKSLRKSKGISQDQASELCGYPRSTIGHIENGRIDLSEEKVRHILECMGFSLREFEKEMKHESTRSEIIEFCADRINQLCDEKLDIVRSLLNSFT
jgi:transcriptional regulator with XRE-family HTH domain